MTPTVTGFDTQPVPTDGDATVGPLGVGFGVVLGRELRKARKALGWSRERMAEKFVAMHGTTLTPQALGTYENATRQLIVERFDQLCRTLGAEPADLFTLAHTEAAAQVQPVISTGIASTHDQDRLNDLSVLVDLDALQCNPDHRLRTLARWATVTLGQRCERTAVFDRNVLGAAATLAGLPLDEVVQSLQQLRKG